MESRIKLVSGSYASGRLITAVLGV